MKYCEYCQREVLITREKIPKRKRKYVEPEIRCGNCRRKIE